MRSLRFVNGRPVSFSTTQFLVLRTALGSGVRAWVLVWDDASWHVSRQTTAWLRAHNQEVKRSGQGVRNLPCPLPVKSPWLNHIEVRWYHGKRQTLKAERVLTRDETQFRICAYYGCTKEPPLDLPEKVA
jgi:hypothetical protein